MNSAITTTNIDVTFPVPGVDNDTQGFRDNFSAIKNALDTAYTEISALNVIRTNLLTYAVSAPTSSKGASGDKAGTIYATTDTVYVCFNNYVNTTTSIWAKISADSISW